MNSFDQDCRLYIQLHGKIGRLEKRRETVRERILPELQAGKSSPKDLPFLLVLRKRVTTLNEWKDALKERLRVWLFFTESDKQLDKRLEEIQAGFTRKETDALYVESNKAYQAKLSVKA